MHKLGPVCSDEGLSLYVYACNVDRLPMLKIDTTVGRY